MLLGAAHGVFLSLIICSRNGANRPTNFLFAFIVLSTSWQLFTYSLLQNGAIAHLPHAMWTAYPINYLIGPLFFIYTRFVFSNKKRLCWYDALHFLPFALELYLYRGFLFLDGESKMELYFSLPAESKTSPAILVEMLKMSVVSIVYFTFSYLTLRKRRRALAEQTSDNANARNTDHFQFLARLFVTILIGQFMFVIALYTKENYAVHVDYTFILLKSFTIHAIGYLAINRPNRIFLIDTVEASAEESPTCANEHTQASAEKYAKSGLSEAQMDEFYKQLLLCIQKEEPHLNDDLNLSELANLVGISNHHLSQVINRRAGQTFYDFINRHRVEYAKKLFMNPEYDGNHTIIEIAFKAGFNSKASFNRVFKKHTGQTPTEFRREARKNRNVRIVS